MRFKIAYSPGTLIVLIALHLLAAVSVCMTMLPLLGQVIAVCLIAVSAATVWRDYGYHSAQRIQYCSISNHGSILTGDFGREVYSLPRLIYRSEYLLVLEFIQQEPDVPVPRPVRRKLILSADALQEADFCRLQRYLRFEAH